MHAEPQDERIVALNERAALPQAPRTAEDTGLRFLFLIELIAKVLFVRGQLRLTEMSNHLRLPVTVVDSLMTFMRTERLCEVTKRGETDGDVHYNLTESGRARATEFIQKNQYAGIAPVSLEAYTQQVERQAIAGMRVTLPDVNRAFEGLVIKPHLREQLGAAMNSGRAMFLYGPAGSGKTYLAEQLLRLLSGHVAIPHAICVDSEVIQLFDPLMHQLVDGKQAVPDGLDKRSKMDARWALCHRPVSLTGGELTLDMLNLDFDATTRFYQAPPHVKANNGLFIIDDLGRQQLSPQQLMNRWIVPMDRRLDYQALHNGYKFAIPFDVILVFSTNMTPSEVADEAFLRRLGYKIRVGPLDESEYEKVFRGVCRDYGVPFDQNAFDYLVNEHHKKNGKPLLACYPRDIVGQIKDFALYRGMQPELTHDSLDWAWANYFATD